MTRLSAVTLKIKSATQNNESEITERYWFKKS